MTTNRTFSTELILPPKENLIISDVRTYTYSVASYSNEIRSLNEILAEINEMPNETEIPIFEKKFGKNIFKSSSLETQYNFLKEYLIKISLVNENSIYDVIYEEMFGSDRKESLMYCKYLLQLLNYKFENHSIQDRIQKLYDLEYDSLYGNWVVDYDTLIIIKFRHL